MDSQRDAVTGSGWLKLACVQMQPSFGDVAANTAKSLELIERAADQGASLVVLPELCNTGYVFSNREEAFAIAEPVPEGPTVAAWTQIAAKHRLHLVAGICERSGSRLYNSAVVIGPSGYVGTFRKVHLWNEENLYFEPGDLGFPVFHTPIGRLGVAICYDGWFPETYRMCALQGADIVCVPTNWVPIPGQADGHQAMANILAMAAAVRRPERDRQLHRLAGRRTRQPRRRGNHHRRDRSQRGPAQAKLERLQSSPAGPSHRRL
jgi:predicted amidohydrolase